TKSAARRGWVLNLHGHNGNLARLPACKERGGGYTLELTVAFRRSNCAGMRRRDFLRLGLCMLTALTQAGMSRARQQAPSAWPKDTSVIWL
ncbi:MAG: hypothetical protein NZM42_07570, partial [Gemmatales bacterium]|nr:hypothetical protein [Gemmatales bacterium]